MICRAAAQTAVRGSLAPASDRDTPAPDRPKTNAQPSATGPASPPTEAIQTITQPIAVLEEEDEDWRARV